MSTPSRARFCRLLLWSAWALPLAGCGQEAPPTDPALDAMAKSAAPSLPAVFQGRDLAAWLVVAESEDAHERAMAAWAFAELGHASTDIDAPLSHLLADEDVSVRRGALHAIDRLNRVPEAAWGALLLVTFPENSLSAMAFELLRRFGPMTLEQTELIIWEAQVGVREPPPGFLERYVAHPERVANKIPFERLRAFAASANQPTWEPAFALLAEGGEPNLALLHSVLREGPEERRGPAARGLAHANALKLLRASLADENERVRYWSARGLGWMGKSGTSAAEALLTLVGQDAVAPRQGAIEALVDIGKPAKAAITKWINAQPADATGTRLRTLGQMMLIRIGN